MKYNMSTVMTIAWKIYRENNAMDFSTALKDSWSYAKAMAIKAIKVAKAIVAKVAKATKVRKPATARIITMDIEISERVSENQFSEPIETIKNATEEMYEKACHNTKKGLWTVLFNTGKNEIIKFSEGTL